MHERWKNLAPRRLFGHHHERRHHPRRHFRIWLTIDGLSILLKRGETFIVTDLRLDQTSALSIEAIDTGGVAVPAVIDAATWTNYNPAAGTLVSTDATAVFTPSTVGESTTVSVTANANGNPFSASVSYTVTAALVVIARIRIVENITPP